MSLQVQPLQQQQQPVQVYPSNPTTVTYQSPPHHSNGSFGSVFVVLAIIVVISAVACCLGRFCSRRSRSHGHSHSHNQKHVKQQKQQNHNNRPKDVDIEFGFDKKIAASKPNGHGAARGPKPPNGYGDMKSFELKLGHEGKLRSGP